MADICKRAINNTNNVSNYLTDTSKRHVNKTSNDSNNTYILSIEYIYACLSVEQLKCMFDVLINNFFDTININLRQFSSSEPSGQSGYPSHLLTLFTQSPSGELHWNSSISQWHVSPSQTKLPSKHILTTSNLTDCIIVFEY